VLIPGALSTAVKRPEHEAVKAPSYSRTSGIFDDVPSRFLESLHGMIFRHTLTIKKL
jgi:hypothetical protein